MEALYYNSGYATQEINFYHGYKLSANGGNRYFTYYGREDGTLSAVGLAANNYSFTKPDLTPVVSITTGATNTFRHYDAINTIDNSSSGYGTFSRSLDTYARLTSSAAPIYLSSPKGIIPSYLSTTARNAMSSPDIGATIANTTTSELNYYDGSWRAIANLDGTQSFSNKSFSTSTGIGTTSPFATLHVKTGSSTASSSPGGTVATFENNSNAYLNLLPSSGAAAGFLIGSGSTNQVTALTYNRVVANAWDITSTTAGATSKLVVQNSNNSNTSSHANLTLQVGGTSAGDPKLNFTIPGSIAWSVGADNSDVDKLKISTGGDPGNGDVITVQTTGEVGIGTTSPTSTLHTTSFATAYVAKTANYTATISDYTVHFTSGTSTFTFPTAVGVTGRIYVVRNDSGNTLTLATNSSQTINGSAPGTQATGTVVQYQSTGANWITLN